MGKIYYRESRWFYILGLIVIIISYIQNIKWFSMLVMIGLLICCTIQNETKPKRMKGNKMKQEIKIGIGLLLTAFILFVLGISYLLYNADCPSLTNSGKSIMVEECTYQYAVVLTMKFIGIVAIILMIILLVFFGITMILDNM